MQESAYINESLLAELALTYGVKSDKDAGVLKLLKDQEFMIKFQLVSLAKHHNFFG